MHKLHFQIFCFVIIGVLVLSACNMPVNEEPAKATATHTEQPTLVKPTEVVPTKTAAATATETLTPEPSATSTPEVPKAEVVRETNCRTGPAGNYELIATYPVGQLLEIVARDLGNGYFFVKNPEKTEEQCYLLAQNITITGDTTALPKFTPQPSPTAAPYFKLTFKKFDTCEGTDYAVFTVENVGSVPFRSVYVKVTNQKLSKSVEHVMNAFDLRTRCVLAKNISPLDPGVTGNTYSPPFAWGGHGEKLRAIVMACTEKNLKGTCVTQTFDIKE